MQALETLVSLTAGSMGALYSRASTPPFAGGRSGSVPSEARSASAGRYFLLNLT